MQQPDNNNSFRGTSRTHRLCLLLGAAGLCVGAFFRFWGLGEAPLAVDEYFFGTSMLNIVARGLPEFACDGFYTRGLLIQYLSVPLLHMGASLELATRFWPAVMSLLTIVAAWRIGRLAGGVGTAAVAVILVSFSVWETEFARFGRMYSPFQCIFLWYVYFQIRHLVHGSTRACWMYLALSAVSIFVYAGASFLLLLNFLPLIWRGKRWSVGHLVASTLLLVSGVAFYTTDFRYLDTPPEAAPPGTGDGSASSLPINIPVLPDSALPVLLLGLLVVAFAAFRYRRYLSPIHPSALYWAVAIGSLCFGLFGLGLALTLAGMLLRLPLPVSAEASNVMRVPVAIALILVIWLAALLLLFILGDGGLWSNVKAVLGYAFLYPDIYHYVVRPWVNAIPITTVLLSCLAVAQLWLLLVTLRENDTEELSVQRYLGAALILLLMLAALFSQPYTITRYTYFLYPLVLLFVAATIVFWPRVLFKSAGLRAAATIVPMVILFAVAEDFRLTHLLRINEPEIRYRTAYDDQLAVHYYQRWDFRSASRFVNERLEANDAVIVFDQPLPHYLDETSGVFVREGTENHSIIWGCGGERDLWSNAPLLDTEREVYRLIDGTEGSTWLIMRSAAYRWRDPLEISLPKRFQMQPLFVTADEHLVVYRLPAGAKNTDMAPF